MSKEKVFTYFVWALAGILLVWLFGSVWGIFNNDLSAAAATASGGWHTIGTLLFLGAILAFTAEYFEFTPVKSTVASVLIGGALLALSICAYCGFFAGVY
jgi:hypothetical protein